MKTPYYFRSLLSRWNSNFRYHTVKTQTFTLLLQLAFGLFLLTGLQDNIAVLLCWFLVSIWFALYIQSRMEVEKPPKRVLRRVLRELEVGLAILNAVLFVMFSGTATKLAILFVVYVAVNSIPWERHGNRWIQTG